MHKGPAGAGPSVQRVASYAETAVSVAMMLTKRPCWPLFWNFTTPETLA